MSGRHLRARRALLTLTASLIACAATHPASSKTGGRDATSHWTTATKISADDEGWFPDIAVDPTGRVHIVWASKGLSYRVSTADGWSAVTNLSATIGTSDRNGDLVRAAIAVTSNGILHLFGTMLDNGTGNYSHAAIARAVNPAAWNRLMRIGDTSAGYYSVLQADHRNRLHAVYTARPSNSLLADTFYRRSTDGGMTWSTPTNLSESADAGSSRPQLLIDDQDRLHVSWDEGWDRQTGRGRIEVSQYRSSSDGRAGWSAAKTFGSAELPSAQLVVGSTDSPRGRLAVWRSSATDHAYFQQSDDDGSTWSAPAAIPGLDARPWNSPPFDQYAMATDASGTVHVLIVGVVDGAPPLPWQVIHVTRSNGAWQAPEVIYEAEGWYPEYPRLAIGPRGELHAVWFTRKALWTSGARVVWYSKQN